MQLKYFKRMTVMNVLWMHSANKAGIYASQIKVKKYWLWNLPDKASKLETKHRKDNLIREDMIRCKYYKRNDYMSWLKHLGK